MIKITHALPLWLALSAPALAVPDYSDLMGSWRVNEVAVQPGPVQAVIDNDPQYVGAEISFNHNAIVWKKGSATREIDAATDNCGATPTFTRADDNDPEEGYQVAGGWNVICGKEPWGPGAVISMSANQKMTLWWYDGAILSLQKIK